MPEQDHRQERTRQLGKDEETLIKLIAAGGTITNADWKAYISNPANNLTATNGVSAVWEAFIDTTTNNTSLFNLLLDLLPKSSTVRKRFIEEIVGIDFSHKRDFKLTNNQRSFTVTLVNLLGSEHGMAQDPTQGKLNLLWMYFLLQDQLPPKYANFKEQIFKLYNQVKEANRPHLRRPDIARKIAQFPSQDYLTLDQIAQFLKQMRSENRYFQNLIEEVSIEKYLVVLEGILRRDHYILPNPQQDNFHTVMEMAFGSEAAQKLKNSAGTTQQLSEQLVPTLLELQSEKRTKDGPAIVFMLLLQYILATTDQIPELFRYETSNYKDLLISLAANARQVKLDSESSTEDQIELNKEIIDKLSTLKPIYPDHFKAYFLSGDQQETTDRRVMLERFKYLAESNLVDLISSLSPLVPTHIDGTSDRRNFVTSLIGWRPINVSGRAEFLTLNSNEEFLRGLRTYLTQESGDQNYAQFVLLRAYNQLTQGTELAFKQATQMILSALTKDMESFDADAYYEANDRQIISGISNKKVPVFDTIEQSINANLRYYAVKLFLYPKYVDQIKEIGTAHQMQIIPSSKSQNFRKQFVELLGLDLTVFASVKGDLSQFWDGIFPGREDEGLQIARATLVLFLLDAAGIALNNELQSILDTVKSEMKSK